MINRSVHLCNEISEVLLSIVQSASPSTRKYLGQKCFIIFYEQVLFIHSYIFIVLCHYNYIIRHISSFILKKDLRKCSLN